LFGRATPAAAGTLTSNQPFVGEIILAGFNFAPRGYARCDGQLLPLSQNTALFSLLGTYYGGNGVSNFALPNLNGCVPIGAGQGQGLSLRDLGETGGDETVALVEAEMPGHSHTVVHTYSQALGTTGQCLSGQQLLGPTAIQRLQRGQYGQPGYRRGPGPQQPDALPDNCLLHRAAGYIPAASLTSHLSSCEPDPEASSI
jgi:microcystin-dependent protein